MHDRQRKIGLILTVAAGFGLAACGDGYTTGSGGNVANTNYEASEDFSLTAAITTQTLFVLRGINGNVEVAGDGSATEVAIGGTRMVRSESVADAEAYLDRVSVDISSTPAGVSVRTEQPGDTGGRTVSVDYRITVPRALKVTVYNVNGNIDVDQMNAPVSVTNLNGNVELGAIDGTVSVVLTNGNIEIDDLFGSAFAATTNGKVSADVGSLPIDGRLDLRASNGNVQAVIPRNTSANVAALLTNGQIRVANLSWTHLVQSPTSLAGTLGAGEGTIELLTVNGDIDLIGS